MVHLTRRYSFSSSHRLHNSSLTAEENDRLYGKCNNAGGHGHNYALEVQVAGPVDFSTGMVVDLAELDGLVQNRIVAPFDESSLNEQPQFAGVVPTTENLCVDIFNALSDGWASMPSACHAALEAVRLEETSSNFFEYRGKPPVK